MYKEMVMYNYIKSPLHTSAAITNTGTGTGVKKTSGHTLTQGKRKFPFSCVSACVHLFSLILLHLGLCC